MQISGRTRRPQITVGLACPLAGGNRSNRLRRPPIRLARIDLGSSTSESSRQHPGQTRRWRPGKEAVTSLAAPGCRSPVCAKRRESVSAPSATAAIASTTTSVTRQRFEPADLKITIKRTCRHTFAEHSSRGRQNILTSGDVLRLSSIGNQSLWVIEFDFGARRNGTGREALRSLERPVPLRTPTLPGCRESQRCLPTEARMRALGIVIPAPCIERHAGMRQ